MAAEIDLNQMSKGIYMVEIYDYKSGEVVDKKNQVVRELIAKGEELV